MDYCHPPTGEAVVARLTHDMPGDVDRTASLLEAPHHGPDQGGAEGLSHEDLTW